MNSIIPEAFDLIDTQFKDIDLCQFGFKERSYLAQYMTVSISGTFESLIKGLIIDKFYREQSTEVVSLIESHLYSYFRNPKFQTILDLFDKFSAEWMSELAKLPDKHKTAITSIVNNKNDIAHGHGSSITLTEIKGFYLDAKDIIYKIDKILN